MQPQRRAVFVREPAVGREPPRRFVELPAFDQGLHQRRLGERLRFGRSGGIAGDPLQHGARALPVARRQERAGRVGAGAHGHRVGHQLGVARQRERPHPARFRRILRCREIGEAAHRVSRIRGRRRHAGGEHRPGALGRAPGEQQLPGEPPHRRRRIARREQGRDPLAVHLRRLRQLARGVRQLYRRAPPLERRGPLAGCPLPVAHALAQRGELDPERTGTSQGTPPFEQHGARRVVAALIVQRHRPLAIGRLVARRRRRPAPRHLPRAVGLVDSHVRAEQHRPQRRIRGARGGGALRDRHELRQPVEPRQHPLQPEQRREIGGVRAQRREVDARRLLELTRALELEALSDRLPTHHAAGRERQRETDGYAGDDAIAAGH